MDAHTDTPHPIDTKVDEILNARRACIRALADASATLERSREALADAEREYSRLFREARNAGWEEKELTTHLGLATPGRAPRKKRASSTRKTQPETQEAPAS